MEKTLSAFFLILFALVSIEAQDSADEIARRAVFFAASDSLRVEASLRLDLGSEKKERTLELNFSRKTGSERLFVRIKEPTFLREMKVLQISNSGKSDTWVKTSQGVRRLGTGLRGESLFQSDFITTDFHIPTKGWSLAFMDDPQGLRVLERVADAGLDYATERLYLRSSQYVVEKREFLDASGKALRVFSVSDWQLKEGIPRPTKIAIIKPGSKKMSTLEVVSVDEGISLPDNLFSPGSL